jgi:hypothetical protein
MAWAVNLHVHIKFGRLSISAPTATTAAPGPASSLSDNNSGAFFRTEIAHKPAFLIAAHFIASSTLSYLNHYSHHYFTELTD